MLFDFFKRRKKSAKEATERLHIILAHERGMTRLPFFDDLKADLIKVLSKYTYTKDSLDIRVNRQDGYDILEINVPIKNKAKRQKTSA